MISLETGFFCKSSRLLPLHNTYWLLQGAWRRVPFQHVTLPSYVAEARREIRYTFKIMLLITAYILYRIINLQLLQENPTMTMDDKYQPR